jgi:peroxiredoxin
MKKSLTILALCFLAITVKAQLNGGNFTLPKTLVMPDGSVVPSNNLDSIKKVFGGREVAISIHDDGVGYAHPVNNQVEQSAAETKLNAHLNKPAAEFAFKAINGKLYSLSDLKGKVVVLNFWYTQCGGCIAEMPDLNELKKSYNAKDVVFLAITFDDNAKIGIFLTKHQFDYTIIPNAKKMCNDYDIHEYPVSVVIDRNGVSKYINSGIGGNIKSELAKAIDEVKSNSL